MNAIIKANCNKLAHSKNIIAIYAEAEEDESAITYCMIYKNKLGGIESGFIITKKNAAGEFVVDKKYQVF